MKNSQFKLLLIVQLVTLFLVGAQFFWKQERTVSNPNIEKGQQPKSSVKVEPGNNFVYGSNEAVNELFVFSGYGCGFCRDFYNAEFAGIKKDFIIPGKLKVVFIHDVTPAKRKEMLMVKTTEIAKQYNLYEALQAEFYKNGDKIDSVGTIKAAVLAGIPEQDLIQKLNDPDLEMRVINNAKESVRLKIEGTPTFILNGTQKMGYKGHNDFIEFFKQNMK